MSEQQDAMFSSYLWASMASIARVLRVLLRSRGVPGDKISYQTTEITITVEFR
jgi:hypothetical protein